MVRIGNEYWGAPEPELAMVRKRRRHRPYCQPRKSVVDVMLLRSSAPSEELVVTIVGVRTEI